jgi:capsular exopolysaccharide synthesis family protein
LTPKGFKACERIVSLGRTGKNDSEPAAGARPVKRRVRSPRTAPPEREQGRGTGRPLAPVASAIKPEPTDDSPPAPACPMEDRRRPGAPVPCGSPEAVFSPDLVVLHNPHSVEAEQFRKLRSSIMFPSQNVMPRLILVTSTESGEGKTFVAANLAATIAMNLNHHVLLVDGDMRLPSLHRMFGLQPEPGLSDHLTARQELSALIQRVPHPRLSVVTAGALPVNPAELLTSSRMIRFLDEVKNRYMDRFVVLDSPPITVASEMKILSGLVDGIVLVLKEGGPKREIVQDVMLQLDKRKILGLVGNFASKRNSGSYYYNKDYQRYHRQG